MRVNPAYVLVALSLLAAVAITGCAASLRGAGSEIIGGEVRKD